MTDNVRKVFDMLGVEPNEEFKIKSNEPDFYTIDENLNVFFEVNSSWKDSCMELADFLTGKLEIIKLAKKKKLRDLTPEEYEKWYGHNDCIGTNCTRCPFHPVPCGPRTSTCWVNNKDFYSDKFLDQEVEIPE